MASTYYKRVCAPDSVRDHELNRFTRGFAAGFTRCAGKVGAEIEKIGTDRSHGDRVFAVKIRGEMSAKQGEFLQKFAL